VSQKEFYSLSAFFNNVTQPAYDGNVKDSAPIEPVPRPEDVKRWGQLPGLMAAAKEAIDARAKAARGDFDTWFAPQTAQTVAAMLPTKDQTLVVGLPDRGEGMPRVAFESAEAGDYEKDRGFSYGAWIKLPAKGSQGSVIARMDDPKAHRGWDLWI